MATTMEMFLAGLALVINTFVIGLMYFLGNVILAPFLSAMEQYVNSSQPIPMWAMTYIIPAIWALLIIMEIVIVIAFFVVVGRRVTVDDYL